MSKEEILEHLGQLKSTLELPTADFCDRIAIPYVEDATHEKIGYARGILGWILKEGLE